MLSVSGLVAVGTEGFAIVIRPLMFECFLLHCGPWLGLGSEMVARLSELSPYWVKYLGHVVVAMGIGITYHRYMENKKCNKCGVEQSIDSYYRNANCSGGYMPRCKSCTEAACKRRQASRKRKDSICAEKERVLREGVKLCLLCGTVRPLGDFHRRSSAFDGRTSNCTFCKNAYDSQPSRREIKRRYAEENRERTKQQLRESNARRCHTTLYKLKNSCRARLHRAVKGLGKSDATFVLIGCTPVELQAYLESKFTEGMSWANYCHDGWHVDHIRPCASFDLSSPQQQRECFHYTNLQPLWAQDNFCKGARVAP